MGYFRRFSARYLVEFYEQSKIHSLESFWPVYADEMDGLILMTKDTVKHNFIDYFVESTQIQKVILSDLNFI